MTESREGRPLGACREDPPKAEMNTSNVRSKMARGAVWMVLFKMLERSLGLVSMLILARLLLPEDFGLVAMATSLIPSFQGVVD